MTVPGARAGYDKGAQMTHSARRGILALALAAGLAMLAVAIGGAGTSSRAAAAKTVTVKTRDGGISLSAKTARVGKVKFVVRNLGKKRHNFSIAGRKTPVLKPGKKATLVVSFRRAGRYVYRSTVGADARHGLKGTVKVVAAKPSTPGNAKLGKALFKANCGTCHTLAAAGTSGTIGPNLTRTKHSFATIQGTVTKGKSGAAGTMPPFKGNLTAKQIQDVAAFVYASTH
jgi:mono/diheme cytochrome c family protein